MSNQIVNYGIVVYVDQLGEWLPLPVCFNSYGAACHYRDQMKRRDGKAYGIIDLRSE